MQKRQTFRSFSELRNSATWQSIASALYMKQKQEALRIMSYERFENDRRAHTDLIAAE